MLFEIADGFIERIDQRCGLIPCYTEEKYWNFYEWSDGLSGSIPEDQRTYDAPLCAFVSAGLRELSAICETLHEKTAADYYREKHLLLNRKTDAFWSEETQAYASFITKDGTLSLYAELTNALFVFADAVPEDRLPIVLSALKEKRLQAVTLSHSIYKYEALLKHMPSCRNFVFDEIADVYGSMLFKGASTFYETIEGASAFENGGSLCHGWSAIPVYLYHRYL